MRPGEAVKDLDQAFTRPDTEAALSFYEDSAAAVVHSGRVIRGKEELRKYFTQLFALNGKANQLHTRVIERTILFWLISKWRFAGQGPHVQPFLREAVATSLLRKDTDGNRRIVIDNQNPEI